MKRILFASMLLIASLAQSIRAASAATPAPKIEQTRILHYTIASVSAGMPLPAGARPLLEEAAPSTGTAASATVAGRLCCRRSAPEATQLVIMPVNHYSTALKRMVVHRINTAGGKFELEFCFRDSLNKDTHYWSCKSSNQLDDMLRYAQIIQDNSHRHRSKKVIVRKQQCTHQQGVPHQKLLGPGPHRKDRFKPLSRGMLRRRRIHGQIIATANYIQRQENSADTCD